MGGQDSLAISAWVSGEFGLDIGVSSKEKLVRVMAVSPVGGKGLQLVAEVANRVVRWAERATTPPGRRCSSRRPMMAYCSEYSLAGGEKLKS